MALEADLDRPVEDLPEGGFSCDALLPLICDQKDDMVLHIPCSARRKPSLYLNSVVSVSGRSLARAHAHTLLLSSWLRP